MCYLDWKITLADSDLPKVNEMTRLAGIDVAYPFLDDRVVELSTRVPGDWKVRGNRLRHFFKDAMADFLPPATIAKTKHGFGLPFGLWMREDARLREIVGDAMASLRRRGLSCLVSRRARAAAPRRACRILWRVPLGAHGPGALAPAEYGFGRSARPRMNRSTTG
jgi:hypothetical protein